MKHNRFDLIGMDRVDSPEETATMEWFWEGYLARGSLTLLTSLWKAGKTTLVSGLLRQLGTEGEFLGQSCAPANVVIVSEESRRDWSERSRLMPIGSHVRLMARPFLLRPSIDDWHALIERALELRAADDLDLFVVDPLAAFLPGYSENDGSLLLEMLQPLQRLADAGTAVLILHHPRRERSEEGSTARGAGTLLGFVDIILELHRAGKLAADWTRRRLLGLSRYRRTPRTLHYDWNPDTGEFTGLGDMHDQRFRDYWQQVHTILSRRETAATPQELLMDWPADQERPATCVLYQWLARAHAEKLIRREGQGVRNDPYRYRLENEDDEYWDRGELPPLRDLDEVLARRR